MLGSGLAYWIVRDTLRGEIDGSLRAQAEAAQIGDRCPSAVPDRASGTPPTS